MAKNSDYEAALEKGTKLLQLLTDPAEPPPQSYFTDVEDLDENGYVSSTDYIFTDMDRLSDPFRDLGADSEMVDNGGKNILVHHVYGEKFTQNLMVGEFPNTLLSVLTAVQGTLPYFAQVCNPEAGILIADGNLTVPAAVMLEDELTKLPPLHYWSDIAFLQYLSTFPSPPPQPLPLNYVLRLGIMNHDTYQVLGNIFAGHGLHQCHSWPGLTFDIESEEGRAILGTPNGSGVAWMLIQHKAQLGEKKIKKVTVFHASASGDHCISGRPSLLFWIV